MATGEERALDTFRRRIETELVELRALSEASAKDKAPVTLDQQSVGRLSRMDAMQMQAMAMASAARRSGRIRALEAALERIDDGEFGYCESCGEPVAPGRLEIDPTARLCVPCARLQES